MTTDPSLRSVAESVPIDWGAVRTHLAAHGHRLDADPVDGVALVYRPPSQAAAGLRVHAMFIRPI